MAACNNDNNDNDGGGDDAGWWDAGCRIFLFVVVDLKCVCLRVDFLVKGDLNKKNCCFYDFCWRKIEFGVEGDCDCGHDNIKQFTQTLFPKN